MKFKTDENLPWEAAKALQDAGFDAHSVWDEDLGRATDQEISARVQAEGRTLITLDSDFADVRASAPESHPGIIVLRLRGQDKANTIAVINRLTLALRQRDPQGQLWIVAEDRIRFR